MQQTKIDIWLDCDPGLDDIFAIFYAAHHERINLLGVSTSAGNSTLENTTRNALDMLYHIGKKDIPVYVGSNQLINGDMKFADHVHGTNGLAGVELKRSPEVAIEQNGLQHVYEKIIAHKNQIIWTNTGSFTNLCILLLTYPNLKSKIKQIVIMGGAITHGNSTPAAEFNIYFDPAAFQSVLKLKGDIPLVMIPLETTHMNIATQEIYEKFKSYSHHPFGLGIYNTLLYMQEFYIKVSKTRYPPYHDPLTIFYILHPQQFEVKPAIVEVDTYPTSYGRTNIYFSYPGVPQVTSTTYVTTNLLNKQTKFWDEMFKIMDIIFSEKVQKIVGIEY